VIRPSATEPLAQSGEAGSDIVEQHAGRFQVCEASSLQISGSVVSGLAASSRRTVRGALDPHAAN